MRVEVFKTNITDPEIATGILQELRLFVPGSKVNFDLEDCDNILRIETSLHVLETVPAFLAKRGFSCESL